MGLSHAITERLGSDRMQIKAVITGIIATTIGVLLIGSLMVPIVSDVMNELSLAGHGTWATMCGVVVLVSLVGLVVVALYAYTEK